LLYVFFVEYNYDVAAKAKPDPRFQAKIHLQRVAVRYFVMKITFLLCVSTATLTPSTRSQYFPSSACVNVPEPTVKAHSTLFSLGTSTFTVLVEA